EARDPEDLTPGIRLDPAADHDVETEHDDRDRDDRPARVVVRDRDEDAFEHRDPQRNPDPARAQPTAQPARAVLDPAGRCGAPGGGGAGGAWRRGWKRPRTVGPAPVPSARRASSWRSSPASGDDARSFGGRAARSRGRSAAERATWSFARRSP